MNFKNNLSLNNYFTNNDYIDNEMISSSFFSNKIIQLDNKNLIFEKRLKINICSNDTKKNDFNVKFTNKEKTLLKAIYAHKFDFGEVSLLTNKSELSLIKEFDELALKINYFLPLDVFNKIWIILEEKGYLELEDLNFLGNELKECIYILLSSEIFLETYYYEKTLNCYTLYSHYSTESTKQAIFNYLKVKNRFYITYKELRKIIEIKNEASFKKYMDLFKTNDVLQEFRTNYIFIPLKYMFEEKIEDSLLTLTEDQFTVLKLRSVEELTLQEIGTTLGKTRERIRQIEDKALQVISYKLPKEFIILLKEFINIFKIVHIENIFLKNDVNKKIVVNILKTKLKFSFDSMLNSFIDNEKFKYANIVNYLKLKIKNEVFTKEILLKCFKSLSLQLNAQNIIDIMINLEDLALVEDKYFFKSNYKRKRDKVELIYLLSENGFDTNTFDNMYKLFEKYFPSEFTNENIRNILSLGQITGNIILWDWGRKYIHIKYVQSILDEFDFTDLLRYLNETFEITEQIDLQHYYEENKQLLNEYGIISKYALHSLLKYKYPDEFSYQDSPWVSEEGTERRIIGDALVNLMNENRSYTLDEISRKLQTKKTRIQQLVDKNDNILIVDTFMYMKKIDINFSENILINIINFINSIIKNMQFIYINMIVEHFREDLNCINAYNREALMLDLLRKNNFQKEYQVSNTRIVYKNYPITRQSLNFHYVIETILLQDNSFSLSKNKLFDFFTKRGLSKNNVMLYYLYSPYKSIVRKNSEEFIRLDSLNLSSSILEKINLHILEILEEETKMDDLIFMTSDILPKIQFEWNYYILADLLDNNLFEFYPNRVEPLYIKIKEGDKEDNL